MTETYGWGAGDLLGRYTYSNVKFNVGLTESGFYPRVDRPEGELTCCAAGTDAVEHWANTTGAGRGLRPSESFTGAVRREQQARRPPDRPRAQSPSG